MREIKFRGKMLETGIWIYGCYTFSKKDSSRHVIWVQDENKELFVHTWPYAVDGNTIGQFTGLLDKNGKEIYEGDIVEEKDTYYNLKDNGVVEFDGGSFLINFEGSFNYLLVGAGECRTIEVIGNIHENQKLLEEENK